MKEGSRNGTSSSEGTPRGRPEGRVPLPGNPKVILSKALERASVSIGALILGNMEGCSFLRAFEIKRYIKRYVRMPCERVSVSIGDPLGNLEGFSCRVVLRENESTPGFPSWTQRTLRF
jgi:hypothetical protein